MPVSRANFDMVEKIGLTLRGVQAEVKYDGSPVLRIHGVFMAGVAMHSSAEPATLVVRSSIEDRSRLLEDAPETYYVTDHYAKHPVVLARLPRLDPDALRDLLSVSRRMSLAKSPKRENRDRR